MFQWSASRISAAALVTVMVVITPSLGEAQQSAT